MAEGIISGLISGVIVTILVFTFRSYWQSRIVPWFEERVYKDQKIEGNWFSLYPTTLDCKKETIVLNRHGHEVTGIIICTCGLDEGQRYSVKGSFRNMILPLIYEQDDKSKTDRGTMTLKSVRNGERLDGNIAFYDSLNDCIESVPVIWFRSKDNLYDFQVSIDAPLPNEEKIKDTNNEDLVSQKETKNTQLTSTIIDANLTNIIKTKPKSSQKDTNKK